MILHSDRNDFAYRAKIKSKDLLFWPRLLHMIITHNILPKKRHYDEDTFMGMCLIYCMI